MPLCRYFQQGTCRYGNRCRFEHIYPHQHMYGGNTYGGNTYGGNSYGGGGGNSFGGYRGSSSGVYGSSGSSGYGGSASYGSSGSVSYGGGGNAGYNNYNYGSSYNSSGGASGGGSDRGGTSILRAKAGTQYQTSTSLFGQPSSNTTPYQSSSGFFSPNVAETKNIPVQHDLKEIMQMIINELTIWEHSGQWPLSCFSVFKEQGCFPGLIDHSPEEIRWYLYQARAVGNLEECQQQIKGLYDKAKLVKEQLMTPNAEIVEILTRLARGEKIEAPSAPSFTDKPNTSGNMFNADNGGNVLSSQAASSFTFTLPNQVSTTVNQSFPGFGAPKMNTFSNVVSGSIFGNAAVHNPSQSIFGGSSQISQVAQNINSHAVKNGLFNSHSNSQNMNDSVTYTPMEEISEEMMKTFNAPVYTMGSVPTKPPPKELCGL